MLGAWPAACRPGQDRGVGESALQVGRGAGNVHLVQQLVDLAGRAAYTLASSTFLALSKPPAGRPFSRAAPGSGSMRCQSVAPPPGCPGDACRLMSTWYCIDDGRHQLRARSVWQLVGRDRRVCESALLRICVAGSLVSCGSTAAAARGPGATSSCLWLAVMYLVILASAGGSWISRRRSTRAVRCPARVLEGAEGLVRRCCHTLSETPYRLLLRAARLPRWHRIGQLLE